MKCQALAKSGKPCDCPALKGEERCLFHSESAAAVAHRRRGHESGLGYASRREIITELTRDFRALKGKTDEKSAAARLRIIPLLRELLAEQQQLGRLKKLAREKGLL